MVLTAGGSNFFYFFSMAAFPNGSKYFLFDAVLFYCLVGSSWLWSYFLTLYQYHGSSWLLCWLWLLILLDYGSVVFLILV